MERLMIFSEANIYILSKLVALMRRETGHRYRLNTQAAINQLINEAARHTDVRIQTFYRRFLENLTPEQRDILVAAGVEMPSDFLPPPSAAKASGNR